MPTKLKQKRMNRREYRECSEVSNASGSDDYVAHDVLHHPSQPLDRFLPTIFLVSQTSDQLKQENFVSERCHIRPTSNQILKKNSFKFLFKNFSWRDSLFWYSDNMFTYKHSLTKWSPTKHSRRKIHDL